MSDAPAPVDYQTSPDRYKHWSMKFEGPVATLTMAIDEDAGLRDGYKLKLNSYDLGVDIELNDAVQRIRFEHPEVRTVIVTSGRDRVFCSGANIFMLGKSSHAWKVNFCKFTNETRNGLEDSSRESGLKFLAAVNGACAGGGYELAAACDEIILVDDRSSSVSLPEVPLLGVLPGTGGLTRLTDKRHVRHDHADIFCTTSEGIRGQKAKDWRLVDEVVKTQAFGQRVQERARELAAQSDRPADGKGVALTPLKKTVSADAIDYPFVKVAIDRAARTATLTVRAPEGAQPTDVAGIEAAGSDWYPLQMARQLDDAILHLRTNELDIGTWILKTAGNVDAVLAMDATLEAQQGPLVRARDDRAAAPHAGAPRRFSALDVRADRARLVLRRHAARDRARRRPQLHARAARRTRRGAEDRAVGAELRRLSDGQPRDAPCSAASTAMPPRSTPPVPRSAGRSMPTRPCSSASSRWRPTTSTGTTRSASRSRSARACRPMR